MLETVLEIISQLFIASIQESMDRQLNILRLFFNLTKAYDVINHEILLTLEYYGIRGTRKVWIVSYLSYQ